ncbi:MAG: PAS domain S-box protein [Roseiflexaceae bacterium]
MSQDSLTVIRSPARLAALRQLGLLDTPAGPAFDRLTRLAARLLHAPVALVSLVDEERQFFKSAVGLGEPWATRRETPLSHSFCQYVVASGEPLIIADAREHPLLRNNPAIPELGVVAYAGMPLMTHDGQRLGSFCVIDTVPRTWTEAEIDILRDLSASVITEIELLADNIERQRAEETAQRLADQRKRLLEVAQTVVSSLALDEILPQLQRSLQLVVAHNALSIYWLDVAAGLLRPAHVASGAWLSDQAGTWAIPIDSGIAGAVARSGRAEMVNNAHLDPRSVYPPGTSTPLNRHLIGIPSQANVQVRGVFLMSRDQGEPFTEQEFELAQIFISFASLAIENARLFEQTKLVEEQQRLLLDQIPCLLWTTDRDLRFTSSVGAGPRELGLRPGFVVGMSLFEFFQTDDPSALPITAHYRALEGESSTYEQEWRGRVFQTHVQPFVDSQGGIVGSIGLGLDITARQRAEEALQAEFSFRAAIIERAAEGLCVCHDTAEYPYTAFTVWNDRMTEITGYTMDEINRSGWYQAVYPEPELQARAQARMARMRHGDDLIAEEWEITRADGQTRIVAFSTSVLTTADGIAHVLALLHDITQRKQAEAALRESEERARRLSEVAFEGIAIHDQGVILDANQALAAIFGYEHAEIIGMPILAFAAPESRDLIMNHVRAGSVQPYEVLGLRKDGTRIVAELQAKPIAYQGQLVRVTAIRDITARKQAEAALRESEDRYRSFFAHSIDAILLTAPDGSIFAANPAACQIFDRTEAEICQVGRNGLLDTTDPRLAAGLEQRARTGMFKGELTLRRQDGTLFPGELSTALFTDRDGQVRTSMIIRDITERKRAEQEREQLIDALQEALANIKTLRGLVPICASCKKIRDDSGYWGQLEAYIQAHSDAVFSHGICPDCARRLYGDIFEE